MKPIPLNPETEEVARRVIWFESPGESLADPVRFMAYAVSHATHDDMKVIRRYVSDDDFREALTARPPELSIPAHGRIGIRNSVGSLRRQCRSAALMTLHDLWKLHRVEDDLASALPWLRPPVRTPVKIPPRAAA